MTSEKKWWQKEYDPIGSLIGKVRGKGPQTGSSPTAAEGLAELKKQGMLGTFFRRWKDPAFKQQMDAVAARMKADGVNMKDKAAVEVWVKAHQKEIESGRLGAADVPPVETVVKTGPDVGRNAPCPCGSGKKYKKCCSKKV